MAIRFHELPPQYQRNVLKPYSHMNILNELKLIFSSSESVILVSIIRKCMLTSEAVRCAIRGLIPIKIGKIRWKQAMNLRNIDRLIWIHSAIFLQHLDSSSMICVYVV